MKLKHEEEQGKLSEAIKKCQKLENDKNTAENREKIQKEQLGIRNAQYAN